MAAYITAGIMVASGLGLTGWLALDVLTDSDAATTTAPITAPVAAPGTSRS